MRTNLDSAIGRPPSGPAGGIGLQQGVGERSTMASPGGSRHDESRSGGPPSREVALDVSLKTLVLTDLVDSTGLLEKLGEARANDAFIRHDRLARDLVARHEGREIDKSDGFLLLFDRPRHAVAWALAYHRELRRLSQELGVDVRARVGIHVGEIYLRENEPQDVARGAKPLEIEGLAKPLAARVMSLARGGQTLLTQAAFELVRRALDELAAGAVRWVSHGTYQFKGVKEPVRIFEVGDAEQAPFTVPRDTEKARQRRRLLLPAVAALALVALGVGWQLSRTAVPDAEARTAVAVLGFKNLSRQPGGAWLSTALAELLSSELAAGGQLRLIPGESVARMKLDLSLLETDSLSPETLGAIRRNLGTEYVVLGWYLLIDQDNDRQLTIQPVLQATATGQTIVASRRTGLESELLQLVTQVGAGLRDTLGAGGLSAPQHEAVEATLSSSPMASQLYFEGLEKLRRFDALAARDVLERAVAADPGYALAHAALSQAWSALGYDGNAAENARLAFEGRRGLPREDVLLIEGRYYEASRQLQQAIRSYQALWGFYPDNLEYGLQLARMQEYAGRVPEALATLNALRQLPEPSGNDPRIDLTEAQVAFAVADYQRELTLAEKALGRGQEHNARTLMAEAFFRKGRTLSMLGELEEAAGALEESRRLFVEIGDRVSAVRAMNAHAVQLWEQGEFAQAEHTYREALPLLEHTGNKSWLSTLLNNHATLILERGDLETAESMLRESLTIVREIKDPGREAERLANLAWVALEQGDLAAAEEQTRDALALAETIESRQKMGEISYLRGRIFLAGGEVARAREECEKSLAISADLEARHSAGQAQQLLAEILLAEGATSEALNRLDQAEAIRVELHELGNLATTRLARAAVLLELGRPAEAGSLAQDAAAEFARAQRADDELLADAISARARLAGGRLADARELLGPLEARAARSQNPRVRLTAALAVARIEAAGGARRAALKRLEDARDEALRFGLIALACEARLVHGRIALAMGQAEAGSDLATLAAEARQRGLTLIAEQATALRRGRDRPR
jgi:class 3 adenylate cyclase/tetratricopeptide (TPR) repeat protein/TolB-like protein